MERFARDKPLQEMRISWDTSRTERSGISCSRYSIAKGMERNFLTGEGRASLARIPKASATAERPATFLIDAESNLKAA
jgi:hypothetical protein